MQHRPSSPPPPAAPPELKISFAEFVGLTALLIALTALSIDIMLPALPALASALGVVRENDRQLVVIVYMVGFSFGQLVYGPLSDHLGRRSVLLAGIAIYIAGSLLALMAGSFEVLLLARVVQGLGAASPRVVSIAIVRDLYQGRQMARVMSFAMMVFIIVPVLAPTVGQALLLAGTWRWPFFALLAVGLIAAGWAGFRLPETSAAALGGRPALRLGPAFAAAILNQQTAAYGAAQGLMLGCLLAYVASAQQIFVEVFGLGRAFPLAFGAVASTLALASFTNARIVGRLGMRRVSHTALAGYLTVAMILAVAASLGSASLPVVLGLIGAAFFLFGLIAPNFNALAMDPQGHNAGVASSVVGSMSTAIGAVVGGTIGRAFDGTVLPLAIGFVVASLMACVIVVLVEGRAGLFGRNQPPASGAG